MAVTPAGDPLWAHTSTAETYGGDANKANYQSQGAVNPRTDVTAEQFSRFVEDVANAGRTLPFALLRITCNDSGTPAAPTIEWARMMTGVRSTSYEGDAAPTGFPASARVGDGNFTVTFDASYDDYYGTSQALTITDAMGTPADTSTAYVQATISGSVVTVYAKDSAGAAVQDAVVELKVG